MNRRNLLVRLGVIGASVGGAWWLRDHVLWRKPEVVFGAPEWLDWAERRNSLPTVSAVIAGRPVRALIDSGAQYSVIDRALLANLGAPKTFDMPIVAYGVGGAAQIGKGVTVDVAVGTTRIPGLRAAILELGPLASEAGLGTPLILGQDVLGRMLLDLDPRRRRLRMLAPEAALPGEVVAVDARRERGALATTVTVEGAVIEAIVDTGSSSLLALSRSAAESGGLLDGREQTRGSSIVLGGAMASTIVEARTVTFGDALYRRVETAVFGDVPVPGFPAALIGMAAFEGRRAVLDLGAGKMWLSREMELTVERPARRVRR